MILLNHFLRLILKFQKTPAKLPVFHFHFIAQDDFAKKTAIDSLSIFHKRSPNPIGVR